MSFLCRLWGHVLPEFLRLSTKVRYEGQWHPYDAHVHRIEQPCARCGRDFTVGYVTLTGGGKLR